MSDTVNLPASLFGDFVTRTEKLRFELWLSKALADEHADDVQIILDKDLPWTINGDTLTVTYEILCQYWGDCERKLAAIGRLLDVPGLPRLVNLEELNHGHSILCGIVKQIEALKAKLTPPGESNG